MTDLDVGIIVVTFNSARHIAAMAESFDRATGGLRWAALAIDNASSDGTVTELTKHGIDVKVLESNAGYAAAINAGMRAMPNAAAYLVLNPDVQLAEGAVVGLCQQARGKVGVTVPQVRNTDGTLSYSLRRFPSVRGALADALMGERASRAFPKHGEHVCDPQRYLRDGRVDWAMGGALMISRACASAVGEWDESFFLYSEEVDYCHRVHDEGFEVRYCHGSVVTHEGGGGAFDPRLRSIMMVNRVRCYARRHGRLASAAFYSAVLLHETLRAIGGDRAAFAAARALLLPSKRPTELVDVEAVIPR